MVGLIFRLDRRAANNLFPARALSLNAPIGLGLWILALHGMTQTSVNLFLPLLLQVVHGVSPVFVNFLSIIISCGWTIGTFAASGWSGARERLALASGPVLAFAGLACLTLVAVQPVLVLLAASTLLMGLGIGIYNVHLVARTMASAAIGEQHRLWCGDCRGRRQHRRARSSDRASGGRACGDDGLSVLLGPVRSCRGLYVPLHPPCPAAPGRRAFFRGLSGRVAGGASEARIRAAQFRQTQKGHSKVTGS